LEERRWNERRVCGLLKGAGGGRRSTVARSAIYVFVTNSRQPSPGRRRVRTRGGAGARRLGRRGDTVSTTTSTYLSIENNLARYQKMVANEPAVKTATDYYTANIGTPTNESSAVKAATDYYAANIGQVTSIQDLVSNPRLLSYALSAYGLGDQVDNTTLVTQVLEGGVTSPTAPANTQSNPDWANFAKAFDFVDNGASSISTKSAVSATEANYAEQQFSIQDLVGNYRLLSYALTAYGLGDQVNNKALVTKVLEGGVTDPKALANTLANANWAKFAKAFDFVGSGASSATSSSAIATTEAAYNEQTLESQQGQQDVGVQLALYFQRVAPTIKSAYSVLGDKNLLEAFQTIFGVTLNAYGSIDANAAIISKLMPMSDLQDPTKVKQLTTRFTAQYTLLYGPGGANASSPLTALSSGATSSNLNAATSIMSGIISGNSSYGGSSTAELFSSALMTSLQSLSLGG
jgi:hypothetical protein